MREPGWQLIDTAPRNILRALLYWPAFKLDENGELTTELAGEGLVSLSYRTVNGGWEELDPTLEATGEFFGDNWEYGEPTHWHPMPDPPGAAALRDPGARQE